MKVHETYAMRHHETQWKCRPCHFRQRTHYPFLWPSMQVTWKSYESCLFKVVFQCKSAGGDRFLAMSPSFTNHSVSWTSAMPSPISASIEFEWFWKKCEGSRMISNISDQQPVWIAGRPSKSGMSLKGALSNVQSSAYVTCCQFDTFAPEKTWLRNACLHLGCGSCCTQAEEIRFNPGFESSTPEKKKRLKIKFDCLVPLVPVVPLVFGDTK